MASINPEPSSNVPLTNQRHRAFQVQNVPKGIFPLFSKTSDSFIYEKKFYCDLPQSIIPPKSFHYPFSLDNFCKTDLLTMSFDLKKNNEILTDPKLNTPIHQDFINNSLALIAPNTTISPDPKKYEQLKQSIIEIIDKNEDALTEKKSSFKPFYLRTSTYLRTSLNLKNENPFTKTQKKPIQKSQNKISPQNIKGQIEQSFKDIDKIKEGNEHPFKKGVKAKKVYNVLPLDNFPSSEFYQYIFPIDPVQEINISKNVEIPEKFLIRKKETDSSGNEVLTLYKQEKVKKVNSEQNRINEAEFYSHEKDYTYNSAKEYELFNRYLIFMDHKNNTAKFSMLKNKFTLKKYKKAIQNYGDENEEYYANNFLNNKRERDLVVIPQEIRKEGLIERNQWYKSFGFNTEFKPKEINSIDYSEIDEMRKEIERMEEEQRKKRESQMNNIEVSVNEEPEEKSDDDENYFGEEGSDRNSGKGIDDNNKDNESQIGKDNEEKSENNNKNNEEKDKEQEQEKEERENKEEKNEKKTPEPSEEDDDDDALFSEDDENEEKSKEEETKKENNVSNDETKHVDNNKIIEDE